MKIFEMARFQYLIFQPPGNRTSAVVSARLPGGGVSEVTVVIGSCPREAFR